MRTKEELLGISGTSPASNSFRSLKESVTKTPPAYDMNGLISRNRWAWIKKNIGSLWHGRYKPYPDYKDTANHGVFQMTANTTIALLSDWASDTVESRLIAQQAGIQDFSIHLGDTYYVGNVKEIAENFNTDFDGTWPYGRLGSFALLGNHEMYSSGDAYFDQLLPYMGLYAPGQDLPVQAQKAPFFCLENQDWRIIALDTGYDSLKGLFGLSPNKKLQLPTEQQAWLRQILANGSDRRGLIFLSHHQCFSAFEDEFPGPADLLAELLPVDRSVLWLWGHEHWFSVYGPNRISNGPTVYGRCIGNGGMPVELQDDDGGIHKPKNNDPHAGENRNLVLYDQRQREVIDGLPLGHNGYVLLSLAGPQAQISYYDDNGGSGPGRKILEETWLREPATGKLLGQSIVDLTATPGARAEEQLTLQLSKELRDAISDP